VERAKGRRTDDGIALVPLASRNWNDASVERVQLWQHERLSVSVSWRFKLFKEEFVGRKKRICQSLASALEKFKHPKPARVVFTARIFPVKMQFEQKSVKNSRLIDAIKSN
jgi:hypothetical protein